MTSTFARHPGRLLVILVLLLHSVIVIYPLFWMITNSFKTTQQIFEASWTMPTVWVVENYVKAWQGGISAYFMNSVIVTGSTIVLTLALSSLAAFGMTRAEAGGAGRAAGLVLMACIGGMLVAPQVALVPLYKMMQALHLHDTHLALILMYTAYRLPITVLLIRAVFVTVPRDLDDSAHIDGCTSFQTLWHVYLPMSRSILLTASVLTAYHAWNEFLFAIIFIDSDRLKTVPAGLMNFRDALMTDWGVLVAGLVISAAPIVIMFILAQRYFMSGFAAGAVKG
ncbi:carbohydrate ABC transporter permease [Pseudotabrizicola alkalilacus]|uniref:sn-glycerol-3-phosphate transport system permease protein UgpE n=1 Tax=Pseudotabrizicola alkalilacus TaxID=2305252 RepID=A0A411YWH9_9RHOB|nr:carbohydrate ABC transporter permease [Pseudotabrizicola alkalilacus]RGP35254.1 carbohydrate ABC transporter permease [Pseudotabrizicola alkalilacus]